ncbi:MAG TPA: glycosyl transferase family 28, partial [Hanamia sp.]
MIKGQKISPASKNTRILVIPLDWGLGHATRCIPIIKELILQNIEVFIVADGNNYILLKREFPSTVFLRYKGYEIKYSRAKRFFLLKLFLQFPKVSWRVYHENKWLKKVIKKYSINAVISDNRFGMFTKKIPCVYITHQLHIETGNQFSDLIAQKIHYYFIKKFDQCWVPDLEINGLAGKLSHPKKMLPNIIYIGPLSRF